MKELLGGGFKYVSFSSLFGEQFQFDSYFSDGLEPATSLGSKTVGGDESLDVSLMIHDGFVLRNGLQQKLQLPGSGGPERAIRNHTKSLKYL